MYESVRQEIEDRIENAGWHLEKAEDLMGQEPNEMQAYLLASIANSLNALTQMKWQSFDA